MLGLDPLLLTRLQDVSRNVDSALKQTEPQGEVFQYNLDQIHRLACELLHVTNPDRRNPKYIVSLGTVGPTDATMCINDREFLIEGLEWNVIGLCWDIRGQRMNEFGHSSKGQAMLKIIYEQGESGDDDSQPNCEDNS